MQYVVCYDISDDRRRDQMADHLKDFGRRVEYSVFVANLDEELAERMVAGVKRLVKGEDRAHVFALCGACAGRTVTAGVGEVPADAEFYVV